MLCVVSLCVPIISCHFSILQLFSIPCLASVCGVYVAFTLRVRSFVVVVFYVVLVCTCLFLLHSGVVLSLCSVFVLRLDPHVLPLAEKPDERYYFAHSRGSGCRCCYSVKMLFTHF